MGKRVFDVAVSAAALVILSPVLALVAAAVKLDSPGPVIFRQVRVGRGGRLFRISKFRTMRVAPPGLAGPDITVEGDARVTRVGRLLRATKLDELPQLVDVLRGDMSLVGPRPELPAYVDRWPAQARATILSVRPGITDPASVTYRHESEQLASAPDPESYYLSTVLPRKVQMYEDYVRTRSFRADLLILLRTAVSLGRSAPVSAGDDGRTR